MKNVLFGSLMLLLQVLSFQSFAVSPSFLTYTNPVIPGDHPDPTLTQIGADFYTAGSSFNPTPIIYHSTDLVHWQAISNPVKASWDKYDDKSGSGCWGGHLVFSHGKYWYYFNRGAMYFVTAPSPKGPWSDPTRMEEPKGLPYTMGYDNSIFVDDNGKWYLLAKNGQANNGIVELGSDGQPKGAIFDLAWLNPKPKFPFSWAEGPVMWKESGYYYYSFAKNVSGGQWVMRTKTLTADSATWEMQGYFFNEEDPLKKTAIFTTPNHSSPVVKIADGSSWVISQSYAQNEWKGHARQGLLTQVRYVNGRPTSDYPANRVFDAPKLPSSGIPWMVAKSDFFESPVLNPEWSFLGFTPDSASSLTDRKGWLRLSPKANKPNTLIKIEGEKNYALITKVDFVANSKESQAGLQVLCSNERSWIRLYCTANEAGKQIIGFTDGKTVASVDRINNKPIWLKLVRVNHALSGYYSLNGRNWVEIGSSFNTKFIDDVAAGWIGTRFGMYVAKQPAFFDLFIYRDAFTPIMAGWPANRNGVEWVSSATESLLDQIGNNDWAMYAGVEFGKNSNYKRTAKTVEFTAASASKGGQVEIWLDAIETGKLVGKCTIGSTGGWDQFKAFKTKVKGAVGRHDVYLRFKGEDRLFVLKSFVFLDK